MSSLDELGVKHGTDKASRHPDIQGHDYCRHYDQIFDHLRAHEIRLLEIGVGGANSIRMWLDYFPIGRIVGVDNNPAAAPVDSQRYEFWLGDQGDPANWQRFNEKYPLEWDIIIDDGGHAANLIQTTFEGLWHRLRPGGFYVIEDVHVFYQGEPNPGRQWLEHLSADIHASKRADINWARLSTALVILHKRRV